MSRDDLDEQRFQSLNIRLAPCFLILAALVLFLGRHHTLTFYNIQQTYIQQMI